jgi:hypothetical protein
MSEFQEERIPNDAGEREGAGGGQVYRICLPLAWVVGRSEREVKGEAPRRGTDENWILLRAGTMAAGGGRGGGSCREEADSSGRDDSRTNQDGEGRHGWAYR